MNPNRPYMDVCGLPGVAYEQDGELFNKNGQRVTHRGQLLDEPKVAPMATEVAASEPVEAPPPPDITIDFNRYVRLDDIKAALDSLGVAYDQEMTRVELLKLLKEEMK